MPHIKNALIRYRIIDKCLRNNYKPYPTKQDLRHACEENLFGSPDGLHICDSTIEKDLFAMRMEHDAPIRYSKKFKGYYYADPNFSINEIPLTRDELDAIKFAASTLSQFKDAELFKEFEFSLGKIIDRISASDEQTGGVHENIIQFETGTVNTGSEFLKDLLDAIQANVVVYFEYESFLTQQRKRRMVTPLLLKEYRNRWYLISYDHVKEAIITYALDRMDDVAVSNENGHKPHDFDPDLFFKHAIGITANNAAPQKIIFKAEKIAAKYIDSQPFHNSQLKEKEGKKRVTFSLFVSVSEELYREILSYGGALEIIQPAFMREEIQRRLKQMMGNYGLSV
ncbi:MAG: WYL domain-containing protein [Crocinitomicaceae bacterium]|nr:WYL domain-containing protein [Crocinitomicaceae bacterium]